MNNLNQHVKSDKVKWIITGIALVLILAILGGVIAAVLTETNPKDWFEQLAGEETETSDEETPANTENGGAVIGAPVENGIKLMSAKIPVAEFAANGVSAQAETAYTLTATLDPADVIDKTVDWAVEFVNPSSSWATGKTVTDYVTVTPTADGALTANIECLQAFGEQIKVVVISRSNSEAKAECTVDYARRILDYRLWAQENNDEYSVFADFGENEIIIDYAAVSNTDAVGLRNGAWYKKVFSLYLPGASSLDLDAAELENAQFSDYTIKDNILFPTDETDDSYSADLSFDFQWNNDVLNILFAYFSGLRAQTDSFPPMFTWQEIFPNGMNFVASNLASLLKATNKVPWSKEIDVFYSEMMTDFYNWLIENPDTPVWTVTGTITGKYSTFTKTFTVRFDPATVALPVFNVSLDNGSIVF